MNPMKTRIRSKTDAFDGETTDDDAMTDDGDEN